MHASNSRTNFSKHGRAMEIGRFLNSMTENRVFNKKKEEEGDRWLIMTLAMIVDIEVLGAHILGRGSTLRRAYLSC